MERDLSNMDLDTLLEEAKEIQRSFLSASSSEKANLQARYHEIDKALTFLKKNSATAKRSCCGSESFPSIQTSNSNLANLLSDDVYVFGEKRSEDDFNLNVTSDGKSVWLKVWTSIDAIQNWASRHKVSTDWTQTSTLKLVCALLEDDHIRYLILDPDNSCDALASEDASLGDVPRDKVFRIHNPDQAAGILSRFLLKKELPAEVRSYLEERVTKFFRQSPTNVHRVGEAMQMLGTILEELTSSVDPTTVEGNPWGIVIDEVRRRVAQEQIDAAFQVLASQHPDLSAEALQNYIDKSFSLPLVSLKKRSDWNAFSAYWLCFAEDELDRDALRAAAKYLADKTPSRAIAAGARSIIGDLNSRGDLSPHDDALKTASSLSKRYEARENERKLIAENEEREKMLAAKQAEEMAMQEYLNEVNELLKEIDAPDTCSVCSENAWELLSVSPNKVAMKLRCRFCGRVVFVKKKSDALTNSNIRQVIPKEVQREVWRRDEGKCVECGNKENLEFDHIIPVTLGGSSTARNIQLLCESCNRRKSAKEPGVW
jgi:hypothetical protein